MTMKTDAIILKQSDYRERDVLLCVFSREYGKMTFVAPGARRISSRNAGSLLPYSEVQILFDYHEGKTMFRLQTANTISLFRHLRADLACSAAAGVVCETADALSVPMEGDSAGEYELLRQALAALDGGHDPGTVLALYTADMLRMFGSAPEVEGCTVCGRTAVSAVSVQSGGFLCREHALSVHAPVWDRESLHRFRFLVRAGISRIGMAEEMAKASHEDVRILMDFLRRYTGADIRAFAFYEGILRLNRDR